MDQPAVGHAILPCSRVDAGDPQPAQITAASAAVAVGVPQRLQHGLIRTAEQTPASPVLTLRQLQDLLVAATCYRSTFYSHCFISIPVMINSASARRDRKSTRLNSSH